MTKSNLREKISNYWYYYKVHTYVGILVLISLVFMITQCAKKVNPDGTAMLLIKDTVLETAQSKQIDGVLSRYSQDLNHDGQHYIMLDTLDINPKFTQLETANEIKLAANFQTGDEVLVLMDQAGYGRLSDKGVFQNVKSLVPNAVTVDDFRVRLSDIPAFRELKIPAVTDRLYLSIRKYAGAVKAATNRTNYDNSVAIFKELLKNQKSSG
ncbi:MAG TPA: hypothetical protein VHR42_06015 [Clostridia bacterium]|nr:hypothetical protein [Clostridia bacterium]